MTRISKWKTLSKDILSNVIDTYKHTWLWMYGMDSKFIRRGLLNLAIRMNKAREIFLKNIWN